MADRILVVRIDDGTETQAKRLEAVIMQTVRQSIRDFPKLVNISRLNAGADVYVLEPEDWADRYDHDEKAEENRDQFVDLLRKEIDNCLVSVGDHVFEYGASLLDNLVPISKTQPVDVDAQHKLWCDRYNAAASADGWSIFDVEGQDGTKLRVMRDDDAEVEAVRDDEDAVTVLAIGVRDGRPHAVAALALLDICGQYAAGDVRAEIDRLADEEVGR